MSNWDRCRAVGRSVLVIGLMMQSTPLAWAQLADVDPALHAAVEALVTSDPEVARDPELAQLCRAVAESTVTDIRERIAVAQEVAVMQREGVDVATVIPRAVRETARETFTRVQGEMQRELERMRSLGMAPEKAKEMELRMREGERQMTAFASGERYVPSTEMIAHATEMFNSWESDMVSRGAPQAFVERARMEMARYSSGEGMMFGGGPGREFGGPGPMGGPGGPPSVEQMQAMGMTADQIQAAMVQHQYIEMGSSGQMPTLEQMQTMGMSAEQIQMAQQYEASSNFGINPSTGGWEPNMGGGTTYGGGTTDWSAGGGAHVGTTDWSAGGGTYVVEGSNYGINPATGGWEPGMGGGTTYTGGTTDWSAGGGTYGGTTEVTSTGGTTTAWEGTHTETYTTTTDSQQAAQERQAEIVAHARISTHTVEADGHAEEHWDGNGDNIPDHTHPIGTVSH